MCKILLLLVLVGLLAFKTTNAVEPSCEILIDGKEYFMKTVDGRYAVLDKNKQLAFVKQVPESGASRFTAMKKSCNVYGLCVDGNCMSRCEACGSDIGDYQTVKLHASNSNNFWSQWTVTSPVAGGPYNLKIDGIYGYLTYKTTSNGDDQFTLSSNLNANSHFQFVEAPKCNILVDGKEYFMKTADGRYAVHDKNKQLAFVKQVPESGASRFTAAQKSCNVYGLCVDGNCMSRCEACGSDIGDYQTVKLHASNSNNFWSQWTVTSPVAGGPYNLKIDGIYGYLTYKTTSNGDDQFTLSSNLNANTHFQFVEAPKCNILVDGKEYFMKTADGRYAVHDKNKQLAFVKQVPESGASRFTAAQKSCNVYGLCVDGNCMSRCEACGSDIGDYQTVKFHALNSDSYVSQWTVTSPVAGGPYNLKIDGSFGYLTYKTTLNGTDQFTLSNNLAAASNFQFVEAPKCNILVNGKEYLIKTTDGRYAVVDKIKKLAFVKQVTESGASRFTAAQKSCNVYGFCIDGYCMSRCEACGSDISDYQTVKIHAYNSDNVWSQWTVTSPVAGGPYNLKIDGSFGYLTYKTTSNGDYQFTLSNNLTTNSNFQFV